MIWDWSGELINKRAQGHTGKSFTRMRRTTQNQASPPAKQSHFIQITAGTAAIAGLLFGFDILIKSYPFWENDIVLAPSTLSRFLYAQSFVPLWARDQR
jgi:hypothetical protein